MAINRITALALLILSLTVATACGRKGDLIIPGTILPQPVADLKAEPKGPAVILAWTMPAKNTRGEKLDDLGGFDIERAELPSGKDGCPCAFQKVGNIDLEFPKDAVIKDKRVVWADRSPTLAIGTKYAYKVTAVNTGGFRGKESNTVMVRDLAMPPALAGFKAAPGDRSAVLGWEKPERDAAGAPMSDLVGFNVYRASTPDEKQEKPVNKEPVKDAAFTDIALTNNAAYYYAVTAVRGAEPPYTEGPATEWAKVTPSDANPPAQVSGLRVVPGEGYALLSWDPNAEPDLAGYIVYRKEGAGFAPLNDKPTDRITLKDDGLTRGKDYTYAVSAVDNAQPPNEGKMSEEVTVSIP